MNNSVYIFGNLSKGYTQYPDENFSAAIFQKFYTKVKATTQIAIHRDGNLMYYAYIRCIEQGKYIGLCVVLNNLMITKFDGIFSLYENVISNLVSKGHLIKFNERGDLVPNTEKLYMNVEEVDLVTESLKAGFDNLVSTARTLPPVNYSTSSDSTKDFSVEDSEEDILKSSYNNGFTYIYKSKNFNTVQLNSYKGVLSRISKERDKLKSECVRLSSQLAKAKAQQRNMKWISILGAIILILGVVIWNKVLYPSEVTHYETGEFVYYGPLKNNKPHGTGVAIYPKDDADGRKYYIGNFVDGERQDTAAILFYQDGDYYYGSMQGDNWDKGILYMNSDNSHFTGSFKDNEPYNGKWYDHKELYKLVDGQKVYSNKKSR